MLLRLLIVALAAGAATVSSVAAVSAPARSSEIVFAAHRLPVSATGSSADIYAVHPDGRGLRRLTHTLVLDESQPSLSPDGRSIVYVQTANGYKCGGCP